MITEQQLHILIGCADARDLNQLQVEAVSDTIAAYKEKGIHIDFHVIRAAGSFVTPDVVMDVKRSIENHQRHDRYHEVPNHYFVHIQSHGHLTEDSDTSYIGHVYDLKIEDGSPLNCGMLGASGVALEIEQLIIQEQPIVNIHGEDVRIDTDTKLRHMLKNVYAHDGYLAGDWIKSIDLLRTHPRTQRTVLEHAIKNDADLKTLNIKISCGLQDYALHALIRVDDGDPAVPFWDDVQAHIRAQHGNKRTAKDVLLKQSEKQKPLAGLLCMPDPRVSSRILAARHYLDLKGISHDGTYMPNTVFNLTGSSFDMPLTPFGPYVIAGFFYSVKHLGLTDQMVMGHDANQTNRIIHKIQNDPIMNLVVNKYGVNLIPVNHVDLVNK